MQSSLDILVGKVGRAQGILGELRIFALDESSTSLAGLREIYLAASENLPLRRYEIEKVRRLERFYAVKLKGIDDRDAAMALCGSACYIRRSQLPKLENAHYVCDLIGLALVDENNKIWGRVLNCLPSLASDLIVYARPSGGGEGMIPYVDAYVESVDLAAGKIHVRASAVERLDEIYAG